MRGQLSYSHWIMSSAVLYAQYHLAMFTRAGYAFQNFNDSFTFRVCLDTNRFELVDNILAGVAYSGFHAALRQVANQTGNCTNQLRGKLDMSEWQRTFQAELFAVSSGEDTVGAAAAAIRCAKESVHAFSLSADSIVETVVPINSANGILSFSPVVSRPTKQDLSHIRTFFPARQAALDLIQLVKFVKWNRLAVLYDPGVSYFFGTH